MTRSGLSYFRLAFICTALGLVLAGVIGHLTGDGVAKAIFICAVLSILEISLSFDNAVVNASVLGRMTPRWRRRFITWGILIAVFGMRLLFPLAIVSLMGKLGPLEAFDLAVNNPDDYASIMDEAHLPVAAFGGVFLLMVALRHFFTEQKDYWMKPVEKLMARIGHLPMADVAVALMVIGGLAPFTTTEFVYTGILGLVVFIIVGGLSSFLGRNQKNNHLASVGLFVYLEVLDASFSFDGVIGAFAITTSLFLITIGLGIGAFYVRSLTMLLVDKGALKDFRYLEQGAFWAILALAVIMFVSIFVQVPEIITGLIGAGLIGASLWSSIKDRHQALPITRSP